MTAPDKPPIATKSAATRGRVLLVDDDVAVAHALRALLTARGYDAVTATEVSEIDAMVEQFAPEAVVLDYSMPGTTGLAVLADLRAHDPTLTVVMLSGEMDVPLTVRALRAGAEDVLLKPADSEHLIAALDRGLTHTRLLRTHRTQAEVTLDPFGYIDDSPTMTRVLRTIEQVAVGTMPVMLIGEVGTGKRALAQLLHQRSSRVGQPFAMYFCAPRDASQIERALLGVTVDATANDETGLLRATNGGTLVLDEPQQLSAATQDALLHASASVGRGVGSRLVITSRRDMAEDVRRGALRPEVYRRLAAMPIMVPPLRTRGELAIRELAERFLATERTRVAEGPYHFAPGALTELYAAPWPGNVRQLRAVVDEAFAVAIDEGAIDSTHVRAVLARRGLHDDTATSDDHSLKTLERRHIARILTLTGGQRAETARLLGITRTTLYKKIDDYQLEPDEQG